MSEFKQILPGMYLASEVDLVLANEREVNASFATKNIQLGFELQRHKRAIEWLIKNAMDIPDSAWSAVPSDIADLVKGEK